MQHFRFLASATYSTVEAQLESMYSNCSFWAENNKPEKILPVLESESHFLSISHNVKLHEKLLNVGKISRPFKSCSTWLFVAWMTVTDLTWSDHWLTLSYNDAIQVIQLERSFSFGCKIRITMRWSTSWPTERQMCLLLNATVKLRNVTNVTYQTHTNSVIA